MGILRRLFGSPRRTASSSVATQSAPQVASTAVANNPADAEPTASSMWTDAFGRVGLRCAQTILIVVVVAMLVWGLSQISIVVIGVLVALIFASALSPVVTFLRRHGWPSILATITCLVGLVGLLVLIGWLIVRSVVNQWDELSSSAEQGFAQLQSFITGLPFSITDEQIESARETAISFLTSSQFGSGALAGVSATTSFFTGFGLMIVVLFFFLKDGPKLWEFALRPFTGEAYERGKRIGNKVVSVLGGYVRGTATVAAVDAVGIGIGLVIIGVPLALPLAVVVFITAFIPIIGATLAGMVAALVALVSVGPIAMIWVIVVVIAVNQLEGNLLQPVLMGRTLQLHALVVLVALTAGAILAGIVGAVLAVPLTAVGWGIVQVWNGPNDPATPFKQKRPETVRTGSAKTGSAR